MFDRCYEFKIYRNFETGHKRPIRRIQYRFKAAKRTYAVIVEMLEYEFCAFKFCSVGDLGNKQKYKRIHDDGDSINVIGTCIYIMQDLLTRFPKASVGFYAVPREIIKRGKREKPRSVRFSIYKKIMENFFDPKQFYHFKDSNKYLYLLINKRKRASKKIMAFVKSYIKAEYDMIFEED